MEINEAVIALDALSQETRLRGFRILVQHGQDGLPAGKLGELLGVPANTLSFHLNQMRHANLVVSKRKGRSIYYIANLEFIHELLGYMLENCCGLEADGASTAAAQCRDTASRTSHSCTSVRKR